MLFCFFFNDPFGLGPVSPFQPLFTAVKDCNMQKKKKRVVLCLSLMLGHCTSCSHWQDFFWKSKAFMLSIYPSSLLWEPWSSERF